MIRLFAPAAIGIAGLLSSFAAYAQEGPVPSEPLMTQQQFIAQVLAQNPSLNAVEEAARAAALRVEPAGALPDPIVSYTLAPASLGDQRLTTGHRVEIGQSFPWPGTLRLREEAAQERALTVSAEAEYQKIRVIAAAKAAYAEWVFIHDAIRINRDHLQIVSTLRESADARYAAGRAGQQDALAADVELALLEDQDLRLEQQRLALQARLNALMNQPPNRTIDLPAALPVILSDKVPGIALPDLLSQAEARHPELRALEHRVTERTKRIGLAQKDFYPDIRITGGYNSLWQETELRPVIGASINVPLNQSRRKAELGAQRADQKRAQWRMEDRRNEILENLTATHAAFTLAGKTYGHHATRLHPLAMQHLTTARAAYSSGSGTLSEVMEAERQLLRIDISLHRAAADRYRKLAELELWAGGPVGEN